MPKFEGKKSAQKTPAETKKLIIFAEYKKMYSLVQNSKHELYFYAPKKKKPLTKCLECYKSLGFNKSFLTVLTISGDNIHNIESFTLKKLLQMQAFKIYFFVGNVLGESFHVNNSVSAEHIQNTSLQPEPPNSRLL